MLSIFFIPPRLIITLCPDDNNECTYDICSNGACVNDKKTGIECADGKGTCQDGECKICTPQCNGKECGPDGCGGTCPAGCVLPESCSAGTCQSACAGEGSFCAGAGSCCDDYYCDLDDTGKITDFSPTPGIGICRLKVSTPPYVACPGGDEYKKVPGVTMPNCPAGCATWLDYDSYRKEGGIKVETSVGEINTWRGLCLSIKGVIFNDEAKAPKPKNEEDSCVNTEIVIKHYLDGCEGCEDRWMRLDYTCPNDLRCKLGACMTECYGDTDCTGGTACCGGVCTDTSCGGCSVEGTDCVEDDECCGYCSFGQDDAKQSGEQGKCCGVNGYWDGVGCTYPNQCTVDSSPCTETIYTLAWLANENCVSKTLDKACCPTPQWGNNDFMDMIGITTY